MERKVARKTEELNKQVRQLQSTLIGAGQCSRKLKSRSTTNDHYLRSGQNVSLKPSQAQKLHRSTVASQSRSLRSNNSPRSILKNKSSCSTGLAPVSASSRRKREALAANHIENIRIQCNLYKSFIMQRAHILLSSAHPRVQMKEKCTN